MLSTTSAVDFGITLDLRLVSVDKLTAKGSMANFRRAHFKSL